MSVIGDILRSTTVNWLQKFIHFLKLDNYVYDSSKSNIDSSGAITNDILLQLSTSAKWSLGERIDLVNDILGWINDNLEELKDNNAIEVNVIQGDALSDFINDNQQKDQYKEVSQFALNTLLKSVILVATDKNGNIINDLMIRSKGGLSEQSLTEFHDQPILKIKIPN